MYVRPTQYDVGMIDSESRTATVFVSQTSLNKVVMIYGDMGLIE